MSVLVNLDSVGKCVCTGELQSWTARDEEQDLAICTYTLWALITLHVRADKCSALSAAVCLAVGIGVLCAYAFLGYALSLDTG